MSSSISRGSLSYGTPVFVGKENKRGTVITADYELIFGHIFVFIGGSMESNVDDSSWFIGLVSGNGRKKESLLTQKNRESDMAAGRIKRIKEKMTGRDYVKELEKNARLTKEDVKIGFCG